MFVEIPHKPFYMVRHGESLANAEGFAAGILDVPLTHDGVGQADALRSLVGLLNPVPDRIFHSNLIRARETARAVNAALGLDMIELAGLAERSYGEWARLPYEDVRKWTLDGAVPPKGESETDLTARVSSCLAEILSLQGLPLIVTHGGIFDAIGWRYEYSIRGIGNCHIYAFEPHNRSDGFPWDLWCCQLAENNQIHRRLASQQITRRA